MPDFIVAVFRAVNVGGTNGLESAGNITIRDDDGNRDDFFDDVDKLPVVRQTALWRKVCFPDLK